MCLSILFGKCLNIYCKRGNNKLFYMEIMCKRGDCLTTINDGVDSLSGEDDCALFSKSVFVIHSLHMSLHSKSIYRKDKLAKISSKVA